MAGASFPNRVCVNLAVSNSVTSQSMHSSFGSTCLGGLCQLEEEYSQRHNSYQEVAKGTSLKSRNPVWTEVIFNNLITRVLTKLKELPSLKYPYFNSCEIKILLVVFVNVI